MKANSYIRSLFFSRKFYLVFVGIILLFLLAYLLPILFVPVQIALLIFVLVFLTDSILLYRLPYPITISRVMSDRFSNGDTNDVVLDVINNYKFKIRVSVIDELPVQFQMRNFELGTELSAGERKRLEYSLRPLTRGEYVFNDLNCFVRSPLSFVVRRIVVKASAIVKVYPSYQALRKYELLAISNNLTDIGSRRLRKIGRSLEFDQVKEYVRGDDIRNINWKATARRAGQLMVNSYMDERSQQVYCIIDKGRVMKMPFDGMTLLDHSINAALILSHVAIVRQDRTGLVTFSNDVSNFIPAERRTGQMSSILESLYNEQTEYLETDYERLYAVIRSKVPQRSLLILFTNFESMSSLRRQLPFLRMLARKHLLLVVFFENPQLKELTEGDADDVEGVYIKTIAQRFVLEKKFIVKELQQHGIMTLLTEPRQLTIQAVNKYLELKSKQAL